MRDRAQVALKQLLRSRSAQVGGAIVLVAVLAALLARVICPYGPLDLGAQGFAPPSRAHWLGTDALGRDLFTRVVYGARLSLLAGMVSVSVAVLVGGTLGAVAGFRGGWVDSLLMRAIDVVLAFPSILVALLVVVALAPGWTAVIIAVGLINVPLFARQIRATVLTLHGLEYVLAARAAGASSTYLLLRVVLPALVSPLVVLAALALGTAVLEVAGLAFLGIAGQIDVPEWGSMLSSAKDTLGASVWPALAPGAAISLTVLGFNLLGDGLRDLVDPQSRPRGLAK